MWVLVLIVWLSFHKEHPEFISGFHSVESCEKVAQEITKIGEEYNYGRDWVVVSHVCIKAE